MFLFLILFEGEYQTTWKQLKHTSNKYLEVKKVTKLLFYNKIYKFLAPNFSLIIAILQSFLLKRSKLFVAHQDTLTQQRKKHNNT